MIVPQARKNKLIFFRYLKERLLPVLINRAVVFFFLMCLFTMFLYLAGAIQEFTDSTQLILLRLYVVLGIFLAVTSVYGMILDLVRFFSLKRKRYLLRAGGYLFLVIFAVTTVLVTVFIITLSGGNGGT